MKTEDMCFELQQVALDHLSMLFDGRGATELAEKKMRFTREFLTNGWQSFGVICGSLHFWGKPSTLHALETLWQKAQSGELSTAYCEEFVTSDFLTKFNIKRIEISAQVEKVKYEDLKKQLQIAR